MIEIGKSFHSTTLGSELKSRSFSYTFEDNLLIITNERERTFSYSKDEWNEILDSLCQNFGTGLFPLGNNVELLGKGCEKDGFGKVIYDLTKSTTKAQGASYLGPILVSMGFLKWNGLSRGIAFSIVPEMLPECRWS